MRAACVQEAGRQAGHAHACLSHPLHPHQEMNVNSQCHVSEKEGQRIENAKVAKC